MLLAAIRKLASTETSCSHLEWEGGLSPPSGPAGAPSASSLVAPPPGRVNVSPISDSTPAPRRTFRGADVLEERDSRSFGGSRAPNGGASSLLLGFRLLGQLLDQALEL